MNHIQKRKNSRIRHLASTEPPASPTRHRAVDAPAVVVLETAKDGLLRVKVESDVMAYILYCHYNEFSKIQQIYQVAITWSGLDNTVMFCLTSQGQTSQLHLAAQEFLSFYHHIASNLVAAPLSEHVRNITIHQYHKATYAIKKFYPLAMIKEVKSTSRIVLYCPVEILADAKDTFLSAVHSNDSFEDFMHSKTRSETSNLSIRKKTKESRSLPRKHNFDKQSRSFSNSKVVSDSVKQNQIKSTSTTEVQALSKSLRKKVSSESDDGYNATDETSNVTFVRKNKAFPRYSEGNSTSSNTSSGYGSSNGNLDKTVREKRKLFKDSYHHVLPPISQQNNYVQSEKASSFPKFNYRQGCSSDMDFYYDDIQHCGDTVSDGGVYTRNDQLITNRTYDKRNFKPSFIPSNHTSRSSPMKLQRSHLSPLHQKLTYIPKLKSPFCFQQQHRKCFEITTPTGVSVEVHEGDFTDADSDVIVNVTNTNLHVTGELAWAVAKHGSFEIPKLTKLHVAMNGPVAESKVSVTPSVGLPSLHIIHAVPPKWDRISQKKCKKLLYNTYKNIFYKASVELRATSIALPVIGLRNESKSNEPFPYHVATEVMYQSLISFLKMGSSTLRHIRYIDNDPKHVNLIVTSIKPKIENVTYDERFVNQHRLLDSYHESHPYAESDKNFSSTPGLFPLENRGYMYNDSKTFFDANFS